jgi:hypothetical protein
MSEYWKSTPKYWCKHCQTFVVDTPLGRKNHDVTAKHQSSLKRFLRDLHRNNERSQTSTANAKREVERLNNLISGGGSSLACPAAALSVAKPEPKKAERWGVAKRGLTDAEKRRQMKELEALGVAMPEEFRGDLAMPGEWTTVAIIEEGVGGMGKDKLSEKERLQKGLAEMTKKEVEEEERKRKWEEMDEDEKAIKGFKVQTMCYPGAAGMEENDISELFDRRQRKARVAVAVKAEVKTEEETTVKVERADTPPGIQIEPGDTKVSVKEEEGAPPTDDNVVFKKRKAKSVRKKT